MLVYWRDLSMNNEPEATKIAWLSPKKLAKVPVGNQIWQCGKSSSMMFPAN